MAKKREEAATIQGIGRDVAVISSFIFGNGTPGVGTRLDKLEKYMYMLMGAVGMIATKEIVSFFKHIL